MKSVIILYSVLKLAFKNNHSCIW